MVNTVSHYLHKQSLILRSILEWQVGQRATTSLQRLGSINQGGVLRLMLHSPTEGGEGLAHAVPSAPITLELHLSKEEYFQWRIRCVLALI